MTAGASFSTSAPNIIIPAVIIPAAGQNVELKLLEVYNAYIDKVADDCVGQICGLVPVAATVMEAAGRNCSVLCQALVHGAKDCSLETQGLVHAV